MISAIISVITKTLTESLLKKDFNEFYEGHG